MSRIVETGAADGLGRCEARVAAPGIGRLGPADAVIHSARRAPYPPFGALCWDSLLRPCRVQSRKFCAERLRGTKAGGCGPTRLADAGSWHLLAVCRVCLASPDDAAILLAWQQHPGPQAVSEDFAQMMFAELPDPHLVD